MGFLQIWLQGFALSMILLTLLWLISIRLKNASIVDPYWGLGFVVLAWFYFSKTEISNGSWIALVLTGLWGLRLSAYLLWRNWGKGEDYRYQQFRQDYGPDRYWWVSYFQVFLLQGVLMSIVSLPVLGAMMSPGQPATALLTWGGIGLWIIGIIFEAGGDYQLVRFKQKAQPGEILTSGLWSLTRHPNYFGDSLVWWGLGLLSLANGYWLPLVGPMIMNLLLLKVSGVSLLERNLKKTKPGYEDYMEQTPAFFPRFPRKVS